MKRLVQTVFLSLFLNHLPAQQCQKESIFLYSMPSCITGDYHLIFEDNFDGNTLDLSKWKPYIGVPRDFDFEKQKAWHTENNLIVNNGTLKIISQKSDTLIRGKWVYDWSTNPITEKTAYFEYSSGEIWSNETYYYGKFEIKCRLPKGKGYWPAFWTFGGEKWNEIDIFEIYGDNFQRFTCNVHHDFDSDGVSENCRYTKNMNIDFSEWHVFTCFYDFDKIVWQIDGETIRVFHRFKTINGLPLNCGENISAGSYFQELSYPREPMHIIMNLAIQNKERAPDESTDFPGVYEIDYVRFYKKRNHPPCESCIKYSFENLVLQPNPAQHSTTVSFNMLKPEEFSLKLFNNFGQEVFNQNLRSTKKNQFFNVQIPLNSFQSGIYILILQSPIERLNKKLVIQN